MPITSKKFISAKLFANDTVIAEIYPFDVRKTTAALSSLYPTEAWGSVSSVYRAGLVDGIITEVEWRGAREFYGKLWNYAGD